MTRIDSAEALRALYGEPTPLAVRKEIDRLDDHCRRFIALSPFVLMASAGRDGLADVSPKGDAPGFVAVLDDHRLAIPDRRGNRRIDSLLNLVERPGIGLLFMIPGVDETLRVNGTAEIHDDPALSARFSARGQPALTAIVVTVREAFIHCGKALMRSDLWGEAHRVERGALPTIGEMLRDQTRSQDYPTAQAEIEARYRESL